MTVLTLSLSSLRTAKNAAIGNPLAKLELVRDQVFISQLVHILNAQPDTPAPAAKGSQDALRIEAAHVIASLSYGSEEALTILLRENTHHALIYAFSHLSSANPPTIRAPFSRALRAFTSSLADLVGPSLWGLSAEPITVGSEAQQALEYLFQVETLDIYLPLLVPPTTSTQVASSTAVLTSIAQMLGSIIRTPTHRRAVTEWLPPADRQKEIRSRRGWEKLTTLNGTGITPWILRQLVTLLANQERDCKLIEAVLYALAALAKESPLVANQLEKPIQDGTSNNSPNVIQFSAGPPPLATILNYTKSRSLDVQLAACLCITHVLRSSSSLIQAHSPQPHSLGPTFLGTCSRTVMNIVNRVVATPSSSVFAAASPSNAESPQTKIKACFILHYLVSDNGSLCQTAFERGCLEHIGSLVKSIAPAEPAPLEWEEDEPESLAQLREAAFTCLASLALCSDDIRRRITDDLRLLPHISRALRAKRHVGTRYAACQCVRAVSRAVAVLRTGLVDSGLGMDILRIVLGKELGDRFSGSISSSSGNGDALFESRTGKRKDSSIAGDDFRMDISESGSLRMSDLGEDARVLSAALSAVCNIVNDFSPLRPIYLEEQLMPRLVYLIKKSGEPALRLNALWAVKNLIRKTSTETKRDLMSHLGWHDLLSYLSDPEPDIQEQAFNILRNLAENEEGIAMVFREVPQVLDKVAEGMRSSNEDVVLQSTSALANLANGTYEQQDMIVKHPLLLSALQLCLAESISAVRRPAVSCILALVESNPKRKKEMAEAGIVGSLRSLCEWSSHPPPHPHDSHHGHGHSSSIAGFGGGTVSPSRASAASGFDAPWGVRSSVRSFVGGPSATSVLGGTYGSWAGTGTLYHYPSHVFGRQGHGASITDPRTSSQQTQPHLMILDDERDVIERARQALEWLEHTETYASATS